MAGGECKLPLAVAIFSQLVECTCYCVVVVVVVVCVVAVVVVVHVSAKRESVQRV